jgi:hypothetical protein
MRPGQKCLGAPTFRRCELNGFLGQLIKHGTRLGASASGKSLGKETNMAQPHMARITCSQCNAGYNSERELRDHLRMAHREFGSEQSLPPSSVQADRTNQGCTTSFLTEQENKMDKLCGRTPAEHQEEYAQPDEEKEAGGEA